MKPSILLIAAHFAPESHAAMFRAWKLARHLPSRGWNVHVLTVDRNYQYNRDDDLVRQLPPEVVIHRASYIEPSLRGIRMALGGPDESYAAQKARGALPGPGTEAGGGHADDPPPVLRRLLRGGFEFVRENLVQIPDHYATWKGPALRLARKILRDHAIDLVWTTCPPYTVEAIGLALRRDTGLPWVADFRDTDTASHHSSSPHPHVYALQRRIERDTLLGADAITTASSAIGMVLTDLHGLPDKHPFHFIPTGLDPALLPAAPLAPPFERPYVVFSGEFLAAYGDRFLRTWAAAARVSAPPLLVFVGNETMNWRRVLPLAERLGLADDLRFIDHVPQRRLYELLAGARAGLLLTGQRYRWWCLYAKLVDFLAMRIPVIADVPDPSEARTRLTEAGTGTFLDGDEDRRVATLVSFFRDGPADHAPRPAVCDRFLVDAQVDAFDRVFRDVLAARHA